MLLAARMRLLKIQAMPGHNFSVGHMVGCRQILLAGTNGVAAARLSQSAKSVHISQVLKRSIPNMAIWHLVPKSLCCRCCCHCDGSRCNHLGTCCTRYDCRQAPREKVDCPARRHRCRRNSPILDAIPIVCMQCQISSSNFEKGSSCTALGLHMVWQANDLVFDLEALVSSDWFPKYRAISQNLLILYFEGTACSNVI